MAIKLKSVTRGIKWYYQKYRQDDYKRHNQNHDWTKNGLLDPGKVRRWIINFKKFGYHRQNKRSKRGVNCSSMGNQKNIVISQTTKVEPIDEIKIRVCNGNTSHMTLYDVESKYRNNIYQTVLKHVV